MVSVESVLYVGGVTEDGRPRKCKLYLGSDTVQDLTGMGYIGSVSQPAYIFYLGDTIAPYVADVVPENGGSGIAVSEVTFTFNEPIFFSETASLMLATLSSLDSANNDPLLTFSFRPPLVQVSDRNLVVTLNRGPLQDGVLYSLALPGGSVVDAAGNTFEGLPMRTYAFRVGLGARTGASASTEGASLIGVNGLSAAGGSVLLLGVCTGAYLTMKKRRKLSAVRPAPSLIAQEPSVRRPSESSNRDLRQAGWSYYSEGAAAQPAAAHQARRAPPQPQPPASPNSTWGSGTWESAFRGASKDSAASAPPFQHSKTEGSLAQRGQGRASASFAPRPGPFSTSPDGGGSKDRAGNVGDGGSASMGRRASAPPGDRRSVGEATSSSAAGRSPAAGSGNAGRRASSSDGFSAYTSTNKELPPASPQRGSKVFMAKPESNESSGVNKKRLELERRLRELMGRPLAERKKFLRELMLEYHPDKNKDSSATEIFQFINSSRGWFLVES